MQRSPRDFGERERAAGKATGRSRLLVESWMIEEALDRNCLEYRKHFPEGSAPRT